MLVAEPPCRDRDQYQFLRTRYGGREQPAPSGGCVLGRASSCQLAQNAGSSFERSSIVQASSNGLAAFVRQKFHLPSCPKFRSQLSLALDVEAPSAYRTAGQWLEDLH